MGAPLEKVRALPRPVKLAGGAILALIVLPLVFLTRCGGSDPDDPTTLELTVEQTVGAELPGYCAEACGRWMVRPPYWYEVTASDDQVAELRGAGWTVNGVPVEETATQESSGESGHRGLTDLVPWTVIIGVVVLVLVVVTPQFWNGHPG